MEDAVTTTADEADELVGSDYVEAALGVNRSTITRRIAAGRLTPIGRLGKAGGSGVFVFRKSEIDRLKAEADAEREQTGEQVSA